MKSKEKGVSMSFNAICSICVRAGSKGVAGKNIRPLLGKPLLAHSILQARESGLFKSIAVSSDSQEILDVAMEFGADFSVYRPAEMASDTAAKAPAIRHCVEVVEQEAGMQFDIMVDLDATSPLRSVIDIVNTIELLNESRAGNVITGAPSHRSPYFNMVEENGDGTVRICKHLEGHIVRRQDAPACYDMNASIYAWTRQAFFDGPKVLTDDTRIYVMPSERSVDIDNELDWEIVEFLMRKKLSTSDAE